MALVKLSSYQRYCSLTTNCTSNPTMQKVARRAVLARNQAKRKARINAEKDRHQEWKLTFQEKTRYNRSLINQAKDERLARREDWMLGPLAPKRDIGERASLYGTVSSQRLQPPKLPKENRRKYLNIVAGDRVCMMKGKDKGKIGAVLNVHEESEHVAVEGVNVVSTSCLIPRKHFLISPILASHDREKTSNNRYLLDI